MFRIDDSITIGGQPSSSDIPLLSKEGFQTIVNFRSDQEDSHQLHPAEERDEAETLGMRYVHLPTTLHTLTPEIIDQFRATFGDLPRPIYAHCATGKRAAALVLAQIACQRHMSADDIADTANRWGLKDRRDLVRLVQNYVAAHAGN